MSKLTKFAKGKTCTINLYPHCEDTNTETTVLAHCNCEDKGIGIKSPDWWGAHACYTCHMILDGHIKADDVSSQDKDDAWRRGIYRTLKRVIDEGCL